MKIGIPKESRPGERRVALIPDVVGRMAKAGFEFLVESGAGREAGFDDARYQEAGAQIVDRARLLAEAEMIVRVQPPTLDEIDAMRSGTALVGFLNPLLEPERIRSLARQGITSFSMELIPRITRAQPMDALSSMSTVAGYKAALLAAETAPRFFPMLVTAAGTLPPAKAFVIGAGVAGLQAIATSRRLGAVVSAYDVRPAVKEQVQSLGARFLEVEIGADTEDAGGYAKELDEAAERRVEELIAKTVPGMDVVYTTALIPGKPAPRLITRAMVESMQRGAVIVDLAAEAGGNCELSQPGETVDHNGVKILAPLNLPSTMPLHASQMYSKNVASFVQHLVKDGALQLDMEDEITKGSCVTLNGEIVHERVRGLVEAAPAGGTTA